MADCSVESSATRATPPVRIERVASGAWLRLSGRNPEQSRRKTTEYKPGSGWRRGIRLPEMRPETVRERSRAHDNCCPIGLGPLRGGPLGFSLAFANHHPDI